MRVNSNSFRALMLCGAIVLAPAIAHAEVAATSEADSAGEDEANKDGSTIIVTAAATGVDIRDAPASVSVITREDIERQPAQSLAELLGRLPGVTGGISPTGAMSKITIRGLSDNYTLMLVNGRRIGNARDISYRPDLGRQNLNWISPDMIERIEVVRGPMSSIYGSDAMGGVINIITRKIAPNWRGSVNTSYTRQEDSDRGDSYQLGGNATGPITDTIGLTLGGTYARTNPDEVILAGNNGAAGVVSTNLTGGLNWRPADGHDVSAEVTYGLEDPVAPATRAANGNAQSAFGSNTERVGLRLGHEGNWGFANSRLDIYHNSYVNTDQADSGGTAEFKEFIIDGLVNFQANLLVPHKLAVGGQYREEELTNNQTIGSLPIDYDGNVVDGATLTGHTAALFVEDQLELARELHLTLGGRLDSHHRYGENFSPRAYLVWHPIEPVTLRGGISRGFRAPSLKENSAGAATNSGGNGCTSLVGLGYTTGGCWMAGNPDLNPEVSINYEVGAEWASDAIQFGATYFYTDFKNKIEYAPLGFFEGRWWTQMRNVQRARTQGLELTSQLRPVETITVRANATWMMEAKNLDTGANLITTPEWSVFGSIDWQPIDRLGIFFSGQYTGKQLGGGTVLTNANTIFDLNASFDATDTVTLRAGVMNLFAERITGTGGSGYYSPGRRFFVGMTTNF